MTTHTDQAAATATATATAMDQGTVARTDQATATATTAATAAATATDQTALGGAGYTPDEMMTVAAARALRDGTVCFVGIGAPSVAANLARHSHAPTMVLVYESGTIGAKPTALPLSIGDGELADTADFVVSVPEIFAYWLQAGRIDVGFLGAAQIDRHANLNTTVIGDYDRPSTRLPGAGGAPEIAASCRQVIILVRQTPRTFVQQLAFRTSVGFGDGPGDRERFGLRGRGPTLVITDLGILRPDPATCELVLTELHPGVTRAAARDATGWELQVADQVTTTPAPTPDELRTLRALKAAPRRPSTTSTAPAAPRAARHITTGQVPRGTVPDRRRP